MVAELYREAPKEPGFLEFADACGEAGPGGTYVVDMNLQETREIGIEYKGLVLIGPGKDGAAVTRAERTFHKPRAVMEVNLLRVEVHFVLMCEHPGRKERTHHAFFVLVQCHFQYFMAIGRFPEKVMAQEVDFVIAGSGGRMPHVLAVLGKDHRCALQ
jgi:hypothetical protein